MVSCRLELAPGHPRSEADDWFWNHIFTSVAVCLGHSVKKGSELPADHHLVLNLTLEQLFIFSRTLEGIYRFTEPVWFVVLKKASTVSLWLSCGKCHGSMEYWECCYWLFSPRATVVRAWSTLPAISHTCSQLALYSPKTALWYRLR